MLTLPTIAELEAEIKKVEAGSKRYLRDLRAALRLARDLDEAPEAEDTEE